MIKKTKILATIGPASDSLEIIEGMIKSGANAFRLNFSHGNHEYHLSTLKKIRQASQNLGIKVGILQDISGPKIRVGKLKNDFDLKSGDKIFFYEEEIIGEKISDNCYKVSINQPQILKLLQPNEYIYLYDGTIRAKIIQTKDKVVAIVENSGFLASNKGINFPNTKLNIDILTPKDMNDIVWGVENEVDFMAISFVQRAKDILRVREILNSHNAKINIYAKIEKFDAVENIDAIIQASDGLMIARGDLGIEVPYFKVPSMQKLIIKKANAASKPVITATQMLLSMAKNETATRAEISDVANAVLDGTDAVMLSEETAIGTNPILVVETMANTIQETEKIYPFDKFDKFDFLDETDIMTSSIARLADQLKVKAIISLTSSGKSAIKLSRYRIRTEILAVAHDEKIARSLTMVWGVNPVLTAKKEDLSIMLGKTLKKAMELDFVNRETTYIVTAGYPTGVEGSTNFIRYLKKDQIDDYVKMIKD